MGKFDFDRWAYRMRWPQTAAGLPLLGKTSVAVEDIKFAFNGWCLLRLCAFYGIPHPTVLSSLNNVTPPIDVPLFYSHCKTNGQLSPTQLKIALTPSHPDAVPMHRFDFRSAVAAKAEALGIPQQPFAAVKQGTVAEAGVGSILAGDAVGIEWVLGHENGMTRAVIDQCDHCVFLPQYGSIGSLSMLNALGIAIQHTHSLYRLDGFAEESAPKYFSFSTGEQPKTETAEEQNERGSRKELPHDDRLIGTNNDDLRRVLTERRDRYPMQLSILWDNGIADRNLGATIRNANIYNCEKMITLRRRKFNVRGSVGTHHVMDMRFRKTLADAEEAGDLDGQALWLLHPHWPHHLNHFLRAKDFTEAAVDEFEDVKTTIVPEQNRSSLSDDNSDVFHHFRKGKSHVDRLRALLARRDPSMWMPYHHADYLPAVEAGLDAWNANHEASPSHPMYGRLAMKGGTDSGDASLVGEYLDPATSSSDEDDGQIVGSEEGASTLLDRPSVNLDDLDGSLVPAIREEMANGAKGIMLVVPEEGCTPTWPILRRCTRAVHIVSPELVVRAGQMGLPPAIGTAIALERLRFAIDAAVQKEQPSTFG